MTILTPCIRRIAVLVLALLFAATWMAPPPVDAAVTTFTVNRNDDITPRGASTCLGVANDCTLREAVIKANATLACAPPSTSCIINFATSTNGTPISLTIPDTTFAADASSGDLDINVSVTIQGNGPTNTVIQGNFPVADNQDNKIFGINQDGTKDDLQVTIDNVTVKGGRNSVWFNDPSFAYTGGGIDIFLTGTTAKTVLSNCIITQNTNVHGYGGGVNIDSGPSLGPGHPSHGSVEITNCTISNNQTLGTPNAPNDPAPISGGGGLNLFADHHDVTITNSVISGNSTPTVGGGINILHSFGGTIKIHNTTIGGGCVGCGNRSGEQGGGAFIDALSVVNVQAVTIDQDSLIQGNVAGTSTAAGAVGAGGGILAAGNATNTLSLDKVTIIDNSVSTNAADQLGGGGIAWGGPGLTMHFSRIVGNSAGMGTGSGLRVDRGSPGSADVTSNWWGCNSGPSAAPCDTAVLGNTGTENPTLTFNPWLVLTLDANPTTVAAGGTSALTADFLHRNDNTTVTADDIAVLIGVPISFGATHGAISNAQAMIQTNGKATATFTQDGTCSNGTATATVDTTPPPTVSTPITVKCPDLTAVKTNNVNSSVPLASPNWTWKIHVANGGDAPANFADSQTILTDNLPATNISYGAAGIANPTGITGTISCSIHSNTLTCAASGAVIIDAAGSFDVSFTATATAAGTYTNPVGGGICRVDPNLVVAESNDGNNDCSNSVAVVGPPSITKAFSPTSIPVGGISTLTFTLTNPNAGVALAGVAFTDSLPAGLAVAAIPNTNNHCSGTLTAMAGTGVISLSGGSIPAGSPGSCSISVDVTSTGGGAKDNTTGAVSSTNGGTGAASNTATLSAVAAPSISKAFSPSSITVNGTSTLSFTLTNPNSGTSLSGVAFSDTLPAGVQVAATPNVSNTTCGGTVVATAGTGVISLSGGSISASNSCTISVDVTATTTGAKDNTTGTVSSTNGGTGATSNTASLTVTNPNPPAISKGFSPAGITISGTSTLSFTLTNPNAATVLSGVAFNDTLPAGVQVAAIPSVSSTCGGTLTATAGSGVISLSGGSMPAGSPGSCSISVNVTATSAGTKDNTTGAVSSTNGGTGVASNTATLTVSGHLLTALGSAKAWIGLKNSDDVGLRVDLLAEVYKKEGALETIIGNGTLLNQPAGGSGFNNAALYAIPLTLSGGAAVIPAGATLEVKIWARRTCTGGGHASGTVRFWYNGKPVDSGATRDAGSRVTATISGVTTSDFFLTGPGFGLSATAGSSRTFVDQFVNSAASCSGPTPRSYQLFGTWTITLP